MLDSHTLGDDFVTATSALWLLLDQLPADVWTSGKPPRKTLVEDWQKATEMLRGCLASIQAGLSDDFADVAALPAEIAFILKRGEFPKLADDEYAKLGAWVTAHADEVYHHLDPANLAKIPRLEEAKKRLRQIHEYNATLRQAAPGVGAGPVARAATEGKQPSAGPSRKRKRTREPKTEPTRPLTDKAAAVLELLRALPPKRAMKGPDILTTLDKKNPPMTFDQSTLTKRIIPELKPYGVRNRPGVGYYIDPSMRRNDATSTPS